MKPADRAARYEALGDIECLCCQLNRVTGLFLPTGLPTERHHLNAFGKAGGKRLGDEKTIPLCSWHHRGSLTISAAPAGFRASEWAETMAAKYGPAWTMGAKRFHEEYPTDEELLATANVLVQQLLTRAASWFPVEA